MKYSNGIRILRVRILHASRNACPVLQPTSFLQVLYTTLHEIEVLRAIKVLMLVTPCRLISTHQRFGNIYCYLPQYLYK